jgi:hypothetical protein
VLCDTGLNGIALRSNNQDIGRISHTNGFTDALNLISNGNLNLSNATGACTLASSQGNVNNYVYISSSSNNVTNGADMLQVGSGRQGLTLISGYTSSVPYNILSVSSPVSTKSTLVISPGNA